MLYLKLTDEQCHGLYDANDVGLYCTYGVTNGDAKYFIVETDKGMVFTDRDSFNFGLISVEIKPEYRCFFPDAEIQSEWRKQLEVRF
jgi:hypothetical protein